MSLPPLVGLYFGDFEMGVSICASLARLELSMWTSQGLRLIVLFLWEYWVCERACVTMPTLL